MEIKYSLTQEDMLELNLFRIRAIPEIAKRQKILRWGYLALMLFLTLILYFTGINPVMCLLLAAIVIGFFFYFPNYQKRQLSRMLAKDYKDPERAKVLLDRLITTDEEGIELTTVKGMRRFAWGDIEIVERTSDAVYVLLKDKISFTVSRKGIQAGDFDAFADEIARQTGKGEIIDLPAA